FFSVSIFLCVFSEQNMPQAVYAEGVLKQPISQVSTKLAVSQTVKGYVTNGILKNIDTDVIIVNKAYFDVAKINLLNGAFFTDKDIQNKQQFAIIGENLAKKFYNGEIKENIENAYIYINDIKYKVVGIYKENASFIYNISFKNTEKIYVSSLPLELNDLQVEVLAAGNTNEFTDNILTKIKNENNIKVDTTDAIDLRNSVNLAWQLLYLTVIICAIKPMYYIFKKTILQVADIYSGKEKLKVKKLLFQIICCVFALISLFLLLKNVNIPSVYLPNNNIFDLSFYAQQMIDFSQHCLLKLTEYSLFTRNIFTLLIFSNIMTIMFWYNCSLKK
ncbi:MAG: ABC transporter permease, partial [Oscillospiraceae bacterium]